MKIKLGSSFRDPAGFVYKVGSEIYRQVNKIYQDDYDLLINSGLYKKLADKGYLIKHEEVPLTEANAECYKIIKPEKIGFISYPYEWSFSMLKDAAILTLKVQKLALLHGMMLKDASAYNIQFVDGRPVFIDTLSFTKNDNRPWVAYKQFCQHFFAPLVLAMYFDVRFFDLLKTNIDGIPLDFVSNVLPFSSKLNFSVLIHIHLHASFQAKYKSAEKREKYEFKLKQKITFTEGLLSAVKGLKWNPKDTEWGDYYSFTNYSDEAMENKKSIVSKFISMINPASCWDLGANNGFFTRIASSIGIPSIAFDIDPIAVEKNYLQIKNSKETGLLPLKLDLTNPSPAIGWNCEERESITQRGRVDLVMALALIHHLAISNNLPFTLIAKFLYGIANNLIIEFVPKTDSKVQILLSSREDIFDDYSIESFKMSFSEYFELISFESIKGSERILFLFRRKDV